MNQDFIRDETFICKYCDNPINTILNKKIPYYYKFPCNHELCFNCIDKSSNNHNIQLKDMDCGVCKKFPDVDMDILDLSSNDNPLKNELSTCYNHFMNMNDKFNNYDKTDKTDENKMDFKTSINDSMTKIYATNYNIIRILSQYNISLSEFVDALPDPEELDEINEDDE
jgi:hypothetical protein